MAGTKTGHRPTTGSTKPQDTPVGAPGDCRHAADPGGTAARWEQDAAATVVPCCPGSLSRVPGLEAQAGVQSWHGAQACRHLCGESRKDSCQEGLVSVGAPQGHGPALLQKVRLAHSQPRERSNGRCPLPLPGLSVLNNKIGIVILFSPTSLGCSVGPAGKDGKSHEWGGPGTPALGQDLCPARHTPNPHPYSKERLERHVQVCRASRGRTVSVTQGAGAPGTRPRGRTSKLRPLAPLGEGPCG